MTLLRPDLCIIGAGSGGLSIAAGAAQMGARVVLVEGAEMGGDCLNAGCVPSKALLAAARAAQAMRSGSALGIAPVEPQIDFAAVKDHVARAITAIAPHDSQERFEAMGVQVIRAWARFAGPQEVQAGPWSIRARRFVIAAGARAVVPPLPGLADVPYLTNETLFALRDKPRHLLVLGGGPMGLEMAQAHRRLGVPVTVVEAGAILPHADRDAVTALLQVLRAEGVVLHQNRPVQSLQPRPDGLAAVLADGTVLEASHLLLATGRRPALERLNLAAAGVPFTAAGVTVDARLRSIGNRRVFAVGDAAGGPQFTHLAGAHAGVVIRQALLGLPARATTRALPSVIYTTPELAQVGLTEAEARLRHGARLQVIRQDFAQNDRARTEGQATGHLTLLAAAGRPVGVTILGPSAGELIGLWALALSSRMKLSQLAGMIAPYPTLGEISKRAAGAYFSGKLFDNPVLKRAVRLVQRLLP